MKQEKPLYWWEVIYAVDEDVTTEHVRACECIITETGMMYLVDSNNCIVYYVTYEPLIRIKRLKKHKPRTALASITNASVTNTEK